MVAAAAAVASSGCDIYFFVCDPADDSAVEQLPARLSEAGLYADIAADAVAPNALSYRPQFELWSDGASKRRWLQLPPGTAIDTSDMDNWRFPEGARLWKEFSQGGIRIETRLLAKTGPDDTDWVAVAYAWNEDDGDAEARPHGAIDARGTDHDIPAAGECAGCHGGRKSFALGVSAIQLSSPATGGDVDLAALAQAGLLTAPPAGPLTVPGNDVERAALGYLHANCGHCHNQDRPARRGARCFDPKNRLDFWLLTDRLGAAEDTPTYESAIGFKIERGRPGDSEVIDRMTRRDFIYRMPPLGSERVDDAGVADVRTWIEEL